MAETATDAALGKQESLPEVAAWRDATQLVLRSARDHFVFCAEAQRESFQKVVMESMEQLAHTPSATQVLITAGVLSQAMSHHGAETQREVDARLAETSDVIQGFLSLLGKLLPDRDAQSLVGKIRETAEQAVARGGFGEARETLLAQLGELAQLAEEKRRQSLELTAKLLDRITILEQTARMKTAGPAGAASESPIDLTTGLPFRAEAEDGLRRAIEEGRPAYAVVFYLHRMQLTNARFGEAIGNQVILFCSQHIATTIIRATDALYRWTGPAFVAIIERPESHPAVAGEIQRVMSVPLSRFFETPSRSVYLPVKVTAEVFPLFETNYAEVAEHLEHFILKASGQGGGE